MEQKDATNLLAMEEFLKSVEKLIAEFNLTIKHTNSSIQKIEGSINKLGERLSVIEQSNKGTMVEIEDLKGYVQNVSKEISVLSENMDKKIETAKQEIVLLIRSTPTDEKETKDENE